MNSEIKFATIVAALLTILILAFMGLGFNECARQEDHTVKCIEQGHLPVECKQAFKAGREPPTKLRT